jgi:hypothetical protein
MVRRTPGLVAVVLAVVAVAAYLGSTHLDVGTSAGPAHAITLQAQEGSPQQGWTTTRRISVACGRHPTVSGSNSESARSICESLAYYASHRHASVGPRPCAPAIEPSNRLVIAGRLDGRPQRLVIGAVCNPTPALGRALQRIDVAAFR